MNAPPLPPDPSSWPTNPYRLLGVRRGVAPRDLRRAYHELIRRYKPEHAPEEFRRIREAYDAILQHATPFVAPNGDDDDEPGEPLRRSSHVGDEPTAREGKHEQEQEDLWELACQGKLCEAYLAIRQRLERSAAQEEPYAQLYWLLVAEPGLDPGRRPAEWVVAGLLAAAKTPTLLELIRRAVDVDPGLALGQCYQRLVEPTAPAGILVAVAGVRSRAARGLKRFRTILADVKQMRPWAARLDEPLWVRLLLAAAAQMAWAEGTVRDAVKLFSREIEQLGHGSHDVSEELARIDFLLEITAGWRKLTFDNGPPVGLYEILPLSWDEPVSEMFPQLRAYLEAAAGTPGKALALFDRILIRSPAVLAHVRDLLTRMDNGRSFHRHRRPLSKLADVLSPLLAETKWWHYPSFRRRLLNFCLKEAIDPEDAARVIDSGPKLVISAGNPLADVIRRDWPLRTAHQACELLDQPFSGTDRGW